MISTTFASSIDKLKSLAIVSKLSKYEGDDTVFHVKGALTETKLASIPKEEKSVVIEDFTKIFLPFQKLKKLIRDKQLLLLQTTKLLTIVVNLYDVDKSDFEKMMKGSGIEHNITYNPFVVKI
jgi:hypothetical protein